MEVSQKTRSQKMVSNALVSAAIGGVMGAGLNLYNQKGIIDTPARLAQLESDILQKEEKIKGHSSEKGLMKKALNTFTDFLDKRDLWSKKDMLKSISENKKISMAALGKYSAFFALDVAMISLAIDTVVGTFARKEI